MPFQKPHAGTRDAGLTLPYIGKPLLPPVMAVPGVKGFELPIFSAPPPRPDSDARPMIFR